MFSQTVRSFNMQHRLLLTGTPLQVGYLAFKTAEA